MARTNPLDAFASTPATFPRDFRIPPMPKLSAFMVGRQFPEAIKAHEDALETWRQTFERAVAERIQVPTAATPATTTTTTTAPVTAAPVRSVNGQVGDVELTTDDVPQGAVNLYLTDTAWLDAFDRLGFLSTNIPSGRNVTIPFGRCSVIAGPLLVSGTLIIQGRLLIF